MAELFQKDVRTINEHVQNVFAESELSPDSVIRKFRITAEYRKTYDTLHDSTSRQLVRMAYKLPGTSEPKQVTCRRERHIF